MTMQEATLEVRLPLGALAPTAPLGRTNDAQRVASDVVSACARPRRQRMAVCDETGLLAVANGRVVDLYRADAIRLRATAAANDDPQAQADAASEAHLPFAGQIVVGDHLEGATDDQRADMVVCATCVAFVAPGFLLVAATASAGSPSVWLCGFRMYARSVTGTHRYAPSSLLVHCSFADCVPDAQAVSTLEIIPSGIFSTREAGAAVVVFDGASSSCGVFQWAERFSDRVLSIASLPSTTLTTVAVSSDAQWVALTDATGAVHVLDFTRFSWELARGSNEAQSLGAAASGKRLALGAAFRMGRLSQRDHPLAAVRLGCQARTGAIGTFGTSLCWWRAEVGSAVKRYLLMGQDDGALAVLTLKKEKDAYGGHGYALKTVEIYPAIRALKNDPVVVVSEPEYCEQVDCFRFSTVSRTSWRQWNVAVSEENGKPRLQWPTLKDSLGLRTHQLDGQDAFGSLLLPSSSSVASRLSEAMSHKDQSATPWLFVLMRDEIRATACFDRKKVRKTPQQAEKSASKAPIRRAEPAGAEETYRAEDVVSRDKQGALKEPTVVRNGGSDNQNGGSDGRHNVLTTLQDRYKLPAMRDSRRSEAASSGIMDASALSVNHERLTKDQYNSRLAAMAQRADRLNTNLHALRTSFQLFTDDVQRHMTFISNHLEHLRETSDSATQGQGGQ